MKFLILLVLFTSYAFGGSFVSLKQLENGCKGLWYFDSKEECEYKQGDCAEMKDGASCSAAKIEDEIVDGPAIYSAKKLQVPCESKESCEKLRFSHCSSLDRYEFFYSEKMSGFEAYCSQLLGHEQVKSGNKFIVSDEAKVQEQDLEIKAKRDRKREVKEKLKTLDVSSAKTIADLKIIIKDILEVIKEE